MLPTITFFPVDNGDMTLIKLNDTTTILIDINIREIAEDEQEPACNVIKELRDRIEEDEEGRPYVDAFLLSHPDQDHCRGLREQFHLGSLDDYNFDPSEGESLKIVIREMWSSPMIFRRASKNNALCEDARAFNTEARRRVKLFKKNGSAVEGDRIIIIGEDENGKTDVLQSILVKVDEVFNKVNGKRNDHVSMRVLGPLPVQDDDEEEGQLGKNRSSVIMQFTLESDGRKYACLFLTGGDAGVYFWEKLSEKQGSTPANINYALLQAQHHCSWHSLSYDSWSDDEDPQASQKAKSAFSQARDGAFIVSSSKPIKNDESDPPCWGAKNEYLSILESVEGEFFCTEEHPNEENPEPLTFKVANEGPQPPSKKSVPIMGSVVGAVSTREPWKHG
ncbi:MAG TPA: metallohydrolase [Deltaproteobacteria bacterium]|nr:metallohydrolase [Deltaproteobacteria bacterium]